MKRLANLSDWCAWLLLQLLKVCDVGWIFLSELEHVQKENDKLRPFYSQFKS